MYKKVKRMINIAIKDELRLGNYIIIKNNLGTCKLYFTAQKAN